MALTIVTNGNTAQANDLNQVINILQQPSGGQEKGRYWLAGWANAANNIISFYVCSQSRNSTPVSASIDTADQAPTAGLGTPTAVHLTNGGFQVSDQATGATAGSFCGGNYTIQF